MSLPVFYLDRGNGLQNTTVDVSANSDLAFGTDDFSICWYNRVFWNQGSQIVQNKCIIQSLL